MEHIQISKTEMDQLFDGNKVKIEGESLYNGSYHHVYIHSGMDGDDKWDGFCRSSYFHPEGSMVRYENGEIYRVNHNKTVLNNRGQNPYQWCIVDSLINPDIELTILSGVAGSGKTYLPLAYALAVIDLDNRFNNIVLSRPKQDLARDEGHLPGNGDDKIAPYIMPFFDNAKSMGYSQVFRKKLDRGDDIGGIMIQPLEKIKGRSFENCIVIIDEAEDMRYREIKSLLTRGDGSEIILSGDIDQTDDETFSKRNIPLNYSIAKFKNQPFSSHIYNPITNRKGRVTKFVIDNFSEEEWEKGGW